MLVLFSFIAILACFACAIFAVKDKLSPQFLFCGFIGIITLFASIPGFPPANIQTYVLIIAGIFAYTVGCNTGNHFVRISRGRTLDYHIRSTFVLVFVVALLCWSLYRTVTVVVPLLMMGQPLDTVRMVYFGEEYEGFSYRPIDAIVETYINQPFLYALIPIASIELFKNSGERQLPLYTLVLLIIWIVLSCVISGGRMLIFCLIIIAGVTFLINRGKLKLSNTLKRKGGSWIPVISLGILIYIVYLLSVNRNEDGESYDFVRSIHSYFCGCIPHTAMRLEMETIDYTYGMTFLQGVLRPFALVYKYTIGGGSFPDLYQKAIDIAVVLQDEVQIGSFTFNAYALPFYFFYFDGGIIAVILESFLYGSFCSITYIRYKKSPSDIRLARYLVVVIYIFSSMIRFSPYIAYFALAFFYINFCYKRYS